MKGQKEKRRERAKKLLKFGLGLELTGLIGLDRETILGYLLDFESRNILERNKYQEVGEKILKNMEDFDSKKVRELSYMDLKTRNHMLITKGALFEIAGIDEKLDVVLGYLEEFGKRNESYHARCYQEGAIYFMKKRSVK